MSATPAKRPARLGVVTMACPPSDPLVPQEARALLVGPLALHRCDLPMVPADAPPTDDTREMVWLVYRITHIATGYAIGTVIGDLKDAYRMACAILDAAGEEAVAALTPDGSDTGHVAVFVAVNALIAAGMMHPGALGDAIIRPAHWPKEELCAPSP